MHGPLSQEGRNFQWQLPDGMPNQPPADIQQPIVIQPPVPIQPPAQVVAGVRCAARNQNIINHTAHQVHPRFSDKLWCTKGKHWVGTAVFGTLLTCDACQATDCARTAQLREQQLAQEGQLAAMQLAAQIGLDNPQVPPPPINHNHPEPPPAISPPIDLLSAVCRR